METTQHSQAAIAVMHLHVTHVNLAAVEQTPAQANRHDMSVCILQNNRPHTLNIDPWLVSNVIWTCSSVNPLLGRQSAARFRSHRREMSRGVPRDAMDSSCYPKDLTYDQLSEVGPTYSN